MLPNAGYFIALVVIGNRELAETEVFRDTKTGNGQKWLMLEIRDKEIMDNVFKLINLRKRSMLLSNEPNQRSGFWRIRCFFAYIQFESLRPAGHPAGSHGGSDGKGPDRESGTGGAVCSGGDGGHQPP